MAHNTHTLEANPVAFNHEYCIKCNMCECVEDKKGVAWLDKPCLAD